MSNIKLAIVPSFDSPDVIGDGGIRRVVEAQKKYLPALGFEIIADIKGADLVAVHGAYPVETNKLSVLHTHGLYWTPEYEWSTWAHKANEGVVASMRRADLVTAPSQWVARILARGMWLDTPVLYHGIDPEDWEPPPSTSTELDSKPYVLWNKTRIDSICEVETLTKLSLMAQDVDFVSTFGPLHNNIIHTGRLPFETAKKYIQNASVYLCNTRETFGIGTLEAMACGVPILGWNWGGQREIVTHKVHGWLAQPGDFDGLLEGLRYCLANREELGAAARAHVLENFTWKVAIERYATLYKELYRQSRIIRPKVSVIITCYNLAQYLGRAVNSVLAQTMKDFEIVIVNDASPDNTLEVAQTLVKKDKRIKIVNNPQNLYLAGALNAGINASSGKYIIPLDADNELDPQALQLLSEPLDNGWLDVGTALRHPVDITYGSMEVVEEDDTRWTSDWPPRNFSYEDQLNHHNQISSTAMYRRKIWQRIGGYRRRCPTAEDADFWCRAASFGAVPHKVTDAITLIYHNRSDSMSHVNKDWAWHEWYTFGGIVPFGAALPPNSEKLVIQTHEPPKISVIIPVGPLHTELVVDAVDSIVNQTYDKWDIIIVNDSGKDLPWIHPFVKILVTNGQGGMGPAISRNIGIAASTTPLFILLDADDFLQPEALQLMFGAWEPGTYVYTDWVVHETGEIHETENYHCSQVTQKLPHAVTCLYEKAGWVSVGGFDEKMLAWEDWDFVIALASKGYCGKRVPVPLLHYRVRSGTIREEKYANVEENKNEIARKWHKYIINGEPLMACGGCGSKASVAPVITVNNNSSGFGSNAGAGSAEGLVQVQYLGDQAPRTYRGPATGTEYRFGTPSHAIKYVYKADAELFASRGEFKVMQNGMTVVEPSRQLEAAGVPHA